MEYLEGALRSYPWGSRTLMAQLRGTQCPAPTPEAELWFGAHHAAPSRVGGVALDSVIAADAYGTLGARVVREHGEELPFLVKLLAAGEPLSIQAHPSRAQAEEGYARENAEGIPLDDPRRNYKDPNPKPELIVALSEFRALAGFRAPERTRELFANLGPLERYSAMFAKDNPGESLRAVFTTLISLPTGLRVELLSSVEGAARELAATDAPPWMVEAAETFLQLATRYPGDVGALAALMLNVVALRPGEALYLGAGQPHAYLCGLGVEVMANSDNVLRGGLTSKHVDVPELARVVDFTALEDAHAEQVAAGSAVQFRLPVDNFVASRYDLGAGESLLADSDGPAVVLCTAGGAVAGSAHAGAHACAQAGAGLGSRHLELRPGVAIWLPASDAAATMTATEDATQLFYVTV